MSVSLLSWGSENHQRSRAEMMSTWILHTQFSSKKYMRNFCPLLCHKQIVAIFTFHASSPQRTGGHVPHSITYGLILIFTPVDLQNNLTFMMEWWKRVCHHDSNQLSLGTKTLGRYCFRCQILTHLYNIVVDWSPCKGVTSASLWDSKGLDNAALSDENWL